MAKSIVKTKFLIFLSAMMIVISLTSTNILLAASTQTEEVNLTYSTYFGGSKAEDHTKLVLDSNGDMIIAGVTESDDFVTTKGVYNSAPQPYDSANEFFVTKLANDGSEVIWSTKLGLASDLRENDYFIYEFDLEIDSNDNIVIVGSTNNINFPTTDNALDKSLNERDVFVSKLSSDGKSLLYSTFIGGSDEDWGFEVELDSNDNIYLAGFTKSDDFPTSENAYDGSLGGNRDFFITKLSADGSEIKYSTYIGGSVVEDKNIYLRLDSSNNAYLTGQSTSDDFPIVNGYNSTYGGTGEPTGGTGSGTVWGDGVVIKLSADGSELLYSTYLGGSGNDEVTIILFDQEENMILIGNTESDDFPITDNAFRSNRDSWDIFVSKISANGTTLLYSTFLGGEAHEYPGNAYFDKEKGLIISAFTDSTDFPVSSNAYQSQLSGGDDGIIVILSPDLQSVNFSSFIGGGLTDRMYDMHYNPATDTIYFFGDSNSDDFPITEDAIKSELGPAALDSVVTLWKIGEPDTTTATTNFPGLELFIISVISIIVIRRQKK
jgi:hypothetical protein